MPHTPESPNQAGESGADNFTTSDLTFNQDFSDMPEWLRQLGGLELGPSEADTAQASSPAGPAQIALSTSAADGAAAA